MDTTTPNEQHNKVAADASSIEAAPITEERASKRQKTDGSAPMHGGGDEMKSVPGDGLHDAPKAADTNGEQGASDVKAANGASNGEANGRVRGIAPIKKEYLLNTASMGADVDDDAAEGRGKPIDDRDRQGDTRGQGGQHKGKKEKRSKKDRGQNSERRFGHSSDTIRICNSRAFYSEFSPRECQFGDNCRLSHDLRAYLASGRRADTEKFGGKCPVFEANGRCASGWKCRFVGSHSEEVEREDGRKEMVLHGTAAEAGPEDLEETRPGVHNIVPASVKVGMGRKRIVFARSEEYLGWLHGQARAVDAMYHNRTGEDTEEQRAEFVDPPFLPSEKRRLYFGPETPALAPLTTQGNLPFRRLCVDMGAQLTYSEMAMGLPLLQGAKADWTLMKCHDSEIVPPTFSPRSPTMVANGYDNSKDFRFGAQISGHHPWIATKAAEALATYCPKLRLIDLNCGCPIDMVYKAGGGSALLDNHGKLERMIRGMNAVSGEIPITAKIRTGVKTTRPTAPTVLNKLAFGGKEYRDRFGAPGCAAVTLHGRSREMRYTKTADWSYIAECAALVKSYNEERARLTDTAAEPDPRTLPNSKDGRMYFLGNGDCYSHEDYYAHLAPETSIDAVMIGRGALVKPWLFEEITAGQYLDKSSTERLTYVEKFVRYGLDAWGSDEVGLGLTRRFLLEWLSFASRYIPVGLLEHLPPSLNDRPPAYKGRDELETLMASGNYKDWIKISEMFLGPAPETFQFQPKHKSNAYEAEG